MKRTIAGLLLFALPVAAQVPYIETLEVRVHSVDVVVTDAKGNPVPGLTREDFQLFEDGVEKPITNFSGVAPRSGGQAILPVPAPGEGRGTKEETVEKRAARKFIFYVDEMSLAEPTRKKLESELGKLIDTTMQPGDEAMVLRPAEEKKLASRFSGDLAAVRRSLTEAIAAERWRADAPILREMRQLENEMRGVASQVGVRTAARRWAGIVRSRVQQRLGQLRAVVNAAAEAEGRKVLVLVTESLPLEPGKEAFTAYSDVVSVEAGDDSPFGNWTELPNYRGAVDWVNLQPLVEEIGRSAATSGITIYSVQAEYGIGMLAPGGDIGATTASRLRQTQGDTRRRNASEARLTSTGQSKMVEHMTTNTEGTLKTLAEMTGGAWTRGGLSIDNLVTGIVNDVESYYSLGYRAGESVDRPHRIEVRVKGRPELKVRTRREVVRKSPQREMTDRVVASLLDPTDSNELGIRVEHKQVGVAPDRQYKTVLVAARVPLSMLTFLPDGDKLKARFSVHYAAIGAETDFVSGMHGEQVVEIPADKFEEVKHQNWTYAVPLNLRPAPHTVALGVLDSVSHLSGFGRVELDLR